MNKTIAVAASALLLVVLDLQAQNRIQFNGQDLFLSGANLAWRSFANDIGPNPSTPDTNHFASVFSQIRTNGGNSLRLWLHTTGANTPAWSGSTVTGPGNGTIADLQKILDIAWEQKVGLILCLWSFDMLRTSNGSTIYNRARDILTNATYRGTYLTNCLIPMAQAVQGHPAIIAWEIFNEPEGMSDEFGWDFNQHVPMAAIQGFINQCAGAIHRTAPAAKVSNGSWSFYAATDVGFGNLNYYTDARLIAAGGDPDGYLDFYMVHYYDWAGTERSPFHHPCSYWQLDKPLVVAEFYPDPTTSQTACVNCGNDAYERLYQNGYAGALAWSWTDVVPSRILAQIASTYAAHPVDVLIVLGPPGITAQPIDITAVPGQRITNNVVATGAAPLSYRWRRDESALPGETNANLVFTNAQVADSGNYSVIVSNTAGSITSRVATLTVLVRPSITLQPTPTNQTVVAGDLVSITVGASGTLPMSYGWRQGATTRTNIITNSTICTLRYTAVATNNNLSTNAWRVGITNIAGGAPGLTATAFVVVLPDSDGDRIPDFWEIGYGLSSTNAADALLDPDGDGLSNWQEWRCGTDPTNALSVLRLLPPMPVGPDLLVGWESMPGRSYFLERRTNLGAQPGFERLATNLPAQLGNNTTTFTHTNAVGAGPWFYRVGVE